MPAARAAIDFPGTPCERPVEIPFQNLWEINWGPFEIPCRMPFETYGYPYMDRVKYLSLLMDIPQDTCEIHFAILFKTYTVIPFPSFVFACRP